MSLDITSKIDIAKKKKDAGDTAFKAGDIKEALRGYHEALLYLSGIDKSAVQGVVSGSAELEGEEKKKSEVDQMLEKIYANQSACYIKNQNWKRAIEASDKALGKNEHNYKAGLRKGKALAEMGLIEQAEKTLLEFLNKKASGTDAAAIRAELSRIRLADAERLKKHETNLRGFLVKNKDGSAKSGGTSTPNTNTTAEA